MTTMCGSANGTDWCTASGIHRCRAFRIHLTERAKAFRPVAGEVVRELDDQVLAALGQREHDALKEALKGVMDL